MTPDPLGYSKLCLHGLVVELNLGLRLIRKWAQHLFEPFLVNDQPDGLVPIEGVVRPYEQDDVMRHISPTAQRVPQVDPWLELYREDERFWLVDERWGICEVNFLKCQFRSWVLPRPTVDGLRCTEGAVLWPLAQLLRQRGLHLVPALSITRDGWGAMMIVPFSIEPELQHLLRNRYQIIGQRWTALREEDGRILMLRMPGVVERTCAPRLRDRCRWEAPEWVDLATALPDATRNYAFCNAVLVAEPGRRAVADMEPLPQLEAHELLRTTWPLIDVHPSRRSSALPATLSRQCKVAQVQLSRSADDLLSMLDRLQRATPAPTPLA